MEEALLKRVLPHSMEAEQSVIGSMIMDREAIVVASEIVRGEDFYNKQYGILFEAMVELNDESKPVDLVTLQDRLREKDVPPETCSPEFIRDLITAVPTSANIKYYAGIVAEKSTLRRLIRLNEEIANNCYVGKDSLENILADTEKRVFDLVQRRNTGEFVPIRQVVMNAMDNIEKYAKLYAQEQEYSIDDFGVLALHTRIDENQTSDHEVTLADVRELVDEAIYYANKKTPGHFMDILFGKRYDQEDMIVLREKDFMHY